MNYITVISFNEDGDIPSIDTMSEEKFLQQLEEHYWGEDPKFADKDTDTSCFVGILVIKGEIVQPKPVEVATRWEI